MCVCVCVCVCVEGGTNVTVTEYSLYNNQSTEVPLIHTCMGVGVHQANMHIVSKIVM